MSDQVNKSETTTHFGFEKVAVEDKQSRVREVFDSVAGRYDVMNDLMSVGLHRIWKRFAIQMSAVKRGEQVLDLASGTGDLAALMLPRVGPSGRMILSDINVSMLNIGRQRMANKGLVGNIEYVLANAESLPFASNQFDCVTMAFGLRNVTDKEAALRSIYRVLKPGGRVYILEFSTLKTPGLASAYDWYSFNVLPKLGGLITQDEDSYRYLAESIRMHPDQDTLKLMFEEAGFQRCQYFNLTGGVVALHRGYKFA